MPHKVGNGAILGIVSEDGVPAQKRITLMDRSNLSIINRAQSDEYGAYAFTGLNPETDDYLIFTVDDDGAEKKAAIIYDYVKPIPAHQGGFYWANWYRMSMTKEPLASIMPISAGTGLAESDLSYGVGRHQAVINGISPNFNQSVITPAAANIPSVTLDNSTIRRAILDNQSLMRPAKRTEVSFEWVLDLSKPLAPTASLTLYTCWGQVVKGNTYRDFYYPYGVFSVNCNSSTNTISIKGANGLGGASHTLNNSLSEILSYVLPEADRGKAIHISGSLTFGVSVSLFVNGVLAKTVSTTSQVEMHTVNPAADVGILTLGSTNVSGQSIDSNISSMTTSIAVAYAEAMTEQEALALYQALTVDSIPSVTGYIKSVIEDYPIYLYRLQENIEAGFAYDTLRPNAKVGNASALTKGIYNKITHSIESIVVGGSGKVFEGGGYVANNLSVSPPSKTSLTIEFTARPMAGAGGAQILLSHRANSLTYFEVQLNRATMKTSLVWRELGAAVNIAFSTVLTTDDIKHYAFSIDKIAGVINFFINGIIVETVATSLQPFEIALINSIQDESIYIGGILSSNHLSISAPYYGYLSEIALYPAALSQAAIKKHYDARLTI